MAENTTENVQEGFNNKAIHLFSFGRAVLKVQMLDSSYIKAALILFIVWPLEGSKISCKHIIDILSHYKKKYLHIQSNISIYFRM